MDTKLPLVQVPIVDYGADESDMVAYRERGTARALELDNEVQSGSEMTDVYILKLWTRTVEMAFMSSLAF
ncbi:MAG: hypothetical protein Ct9H300mP26_0270 [Acidimicrobiales bacterium]|nr:MAG: hypothetical protein Ct9H300mP26_0270 [Acidimicrobiales bacterium]